ncbi:MAG: gamma-glutamyltransferase, partial [Gemmatimonadetes bacterium]|nr:gamma-glutamyltransferase [Gemmatimonadota bacterium]
MRLAHLFLAGALFFAACGPVPNSEHGASENPADATQLSVPDPPEVSTETSADPAGRYAQGAEFMVAASTPEAMQAGRNILEEGGNAIDAAAATAFALMVTDPLMSSVGGRAQILIRLAEGTVVGIDGATQAPLRVDEPANLGHGYGTVPIPGAPAALEEMLSGYGTLPLVRVLEPAIRLAEEGFRIKPDVHDALRTYEDLLTLYPGTRAHFYRSDGSPYSEGEVFRQPALARTLRAMAQEGVEALYRGSLADAFVVDMEEHGGLVRHDDLNQYRPKEGEVVQGEYRSHQIVARGGNCDGASVIEMLQILEHFELGMMERDSPRYIHTIAQALYVGLTDEYVPDWMQVSKDHAARRVREIDPNRALPIPVRGGSPEGDTNHLSVVDGQGNAVAITQS